jgi:hypothetical protein
MRCSRDERFWNGYVIKVIVLTAITIILAGCATYNFRNRNEVTAEAMSTYQCDEVVFGYNDDDAASEPLGYYVECRNYTELGEMTKSYERNVKAKEWREVYRAGEGFGALFTFFAVLTGFLALLFACFAIDGWLFIRKLYKVDEERAKDAIANSN